MRDKNKEYENDQERLSSEQVWLTKYALLMWCVTVFFFVFFFAIIVFLRERNDTRMSWKDWVFSKQQTLA